MPQTPVRLVCFDLGNVLVRLTNHWLLAFERALVRVPDGFEDAHPWPGHDDIFNAFESGRLDESAFFREASERVGMQVDHLESVFDAWLMGLFVGIDALIERLAGARVDTACLSNTNGRHWSTLHRVPAYEAVRRLDHHFASHLIGIMKPDERIYRHVEDRTGCPACSILFFDDNEANIRAATERGWQTCMIDPEDEPAQRMTEHLESAGIAGF